MLQLVLWCLWCGMCMLGACVTIGIMVFAVWYVYVRCLCYNWYYGCSFTVTLIFSMFSVL